MTAKAQKSGTERARDERREGGPRYGGGAWPVADERGDRRFGHARNDDANPSELAPVDADNDDDDSPTGTDPELLAAEVAGAIAGSSVHSGMGRGDHPRAARSPARARSK
jgi:hypothetical protein